ncbi:MAG: hypothetical protein WA001_05220 [Patescibacteria group bacterium]
MSMEQVPKKPSNPFAEKKDQKREKPKNRREELLAMARAAESPEELLQIVKDATVNDIFSQKEMLGTILLMAFRKSPVHSATRLESAKEMSENGFVNLAREAYGTLAKEEPDDAGILEAYGDEMLSRRSDPPTQLEYQSIIDTLHQAKQAIHSQAAQKGYRGGPQLNAVTRKKTAELDKKIQEAEERLRFAEGEDAGWQAEREEDADEELASVHEALKAKKINVRLVRNALDRALSMYVANKQELQANTRDKTSIKKDLERIDDKLEELMDLRQQLIDRERGE